MMPPVGKSGPLICFISPSSVIFGFLTAAITPSITSSGLCGGTLVASPTAIPAEPLISRFGNRAGRTSGSLRVSSKLSDEGTVSLARSRISISAAGAIRASVYRKAAAVSPSIEPKLPLPSTSGTRILKSCASRTIVS